MIWKKLWESCEHCVCVCVCVCVVKNVSCGAVQRSGCDWLPPDIFPLSLMGLNAAAGRCSSYLKAHQGKGFCLIASGEPLQQTARVFFYWSENCRGWGFLNFLELLPTLAVNTPPHTNQYKNLNVAKKLPVFELQLCKKYKCCEKVELTRESSNLCKHFTVWMEFLWECMKEGEELENELVWSDVSLTTIIIAIQQSLKESWIFSKVLCDVSCLNLSTNCEICISFEWNFYLEAWMTGWALKILEKVSLNVPSFTLLKDVGDEMNIWCLNGENTLKNVELVKVQNIRPQRYNNKMKKLWIPCAEFPLHSQPIRHVGHINAYESLVLCMLNSLTSGISNSWCLRIGK